MDRIYKKKNWVSRNKDPMFLPVTLSLSFSLRIHYFKPKLSNLAGEMGELGEANFLLTAHEVESIF
jgi:hypothetical protein